MKVLGIQRSVVFDFKNQKNEQVHLEGAKLFLGEERPGVEGISVIEPVFVNNTKPCYPKVSELNVGDEVNIYYNRFGKVDSFCKIVV